MLRTLPLYKVILEDRRDCCKARRQNTEVRIGDVDANGAGQSGTNPLCHQITVQPTTSSSLYPCPQVMRGRFVVARKIGGSDKKPNNYVWHIQEIRIFSTLLHDEIN